MIGGGGVCKMSAAAARRRRRTALAHCALVLNGLVVPFFKLSTLSAPEPSVAAAKI